MPPKHTTTSVVVGGATQLAPDEAMLLEQMTAPLGPCPTCSTEDLFLTFWTPFRTVHVIVCAVCGEQRWTAPARGAS